MIFLAIFFFFSFLNHIPGLEQRVIGFIGFALSVRAAHLSGTCSLSAPAFSGGFCRKIETRPEPHPSKCKGLQIYGGVGGVLSSYCRGSFIQANANLMCQNTQRPNLCARNPQWHNPITQPVIGPFQSEQPGSGSVSHSQRGGFSGERGPTAHLTLLPSPGLHCLH